MALTAEQLGQMTLADAEALATRLESAARTIRDAMALMGGAPSVSSPVVLHNASATPAPVVQWTPEEMAERERLRRERDAAAEKAVLESRS